MKFQVAAEATLEGAESEPIEMPGDGKVIYMFRPDPGLFALMVTSDEDKLESNTGKFLRTLFSREDWDYLERRMWKVDDVVTFEGVMATVTEAVKRWTGDPTKPSSKSSSSPNRGGKKSTAASKKKAQTPSSYD